MKRCCDRGKGRKENPGEEFGEGGWWGIQCLCSRLLCGCKNSEKKMLNAACTHRSKKKKVKACVCVSCHNVRCKSSVEVVQGRACYSTQLCLTALEQANKHSDGSG